jgi:hypothetical protein
MVISPRETTQSAGVVEEMKNKRKRDEKKCKFHKLLTFSYIKKIECKMLHIKCIHMANVRWSQMEMKIASQ